MNRFRSLCLTAASAVALALSLAPATPAAAAPPSAADFARRPALSGVSVSPDGQHIVALTSGDGQNVTISVWRTDALNKPPFVIGSTRQEFLGVSFVKNDRLLVVTNQLHTLGTTKGHIYKAYITDLQGRDFKPALPEGRTTSEIEDLVQRLSSPGLLDNLPQDPKHILVINNRLRGAGDVYKVNVYSGQSERVYRAAEGYFDVATDTKGDVRSRQQTESDGRGTYIATEIRHPDTRDWQEHFRLYGKERSGMQLVGFSTDPGVAYVTDTKDRDRAGIYEYDVRTRKVLGPAFEHKVFAAGGVIQSDAPQDHGQVLGFRYAAETNKAYWLDPTLAAVDKGLSQALGLKTTTIDWVDPATGARSRVPIADGAVGEIVDWSDDRKLIVVAKSGPQVPPEYYILRDGKLQLLGRAYPGVDASSLGASTLVQYPARDGLMIPAFLHRPNTQAHGPGPWPTVVLPHGGPWARDGYDWDPGGWVQYLTARGYAVMQPQYRGSEGWGDKLWRAGDEQWGLRMQDDKDDGVRWMIAQKIAAPERVAMWGYSYGGYAAIAASVRSNGLYQCAISGAGLSDLARIRREIFEGSRFGREFQRPTIQGVSWSARAKEATIPILIYHGDRDTNVEPEESRIYVNALRAAGKVVKTVELKDMGHSYDTMSPAHMRTQLEIVDDFLRKDCGPGGL